MNSKKLKMVYLVIIGHLLLFNLSCSTKSQSGVSSSTVAQSPSSQSTPSSQENRNVGDDFPIVLAQGSDIPVSVVGLKFLEDGSRKGNLQIEIKNVSEKPIKAVRYWLAPMPCRQYDMPSLKIDYGDSALNPSQTANIFVERKRLEDYLNPKGHSSIECSSKSEEKPHLFLAKVFFDDGGVWEIGKRNNSSDPDHRKVVIDSNPASNNSFNRSANSGAFIENLFVSAVRRARLIRALCLRFALR